MPLFPAPWKPGLPLAALAALALGSSPALAQSQGQFTWASSYVYDYTEVQHSDATFTAGSLQGLATITSNSGGDLFREGKSFLLSCVVFSEQESNGDLALTAPCTGTETSQDGGDTFLITYIREEGDLGAAGQGGDGHIEMMGGTGKYAGVTGRCSYKTTYINESLGVETSDCRWSKP